MVKIVLRLAGRLRFFPEDSRAFRLAKLVVALFLFSSFLMFFLNIDLGDYDFWFHAVNGKYIVSHGYPPEEDPFSFTSAMEENKNPLPRWEHFVLGQNLFSEPLFYEVLEHAGPPGMIILRSLILVFTLLIVYRRIIRSGVGFPVSLGFTLLLFAVLSSAGAERPVLFSFLFTALLLALLEDFRDKGGRRVYWIIPVMLLWANMHGGFIIGDIILLVYMGGEAEKTARGVSGFSKMQRRKFYAAAATAVLVSFVNPTGWDAFIVSFFPKYKILFEGVQEWHSTLYFLTNKIWGWGDYRFYSFAVLVLTFPIILIARNRKLDLDHVLLLSGMAFMALSSLRLFAFYAIAFTILMAKEFDVLAHHVAGKRWSESALKKANWGVACVAVLSVMVFMSGMAGRAIRGFGAVAKDVVPKVAVDFIEKNKIEGHMFNQFSYGGYLLWRLYPWKQNFIDGRTVNIKALKDYDIIVSAVDAFSPQKNNLPRHRPLWQMLLDHYRINLVVLAPLDFRGDLTPLSLKLLEGDNWAPVYSDPLSIIFVRNNPLNGGLIEKFRLSKNTVYSSMLVAASADAMQNKANPRYLISVGRILYALGRKEDAVKAYRYALKRADTREIEEEIRRVSTESGQGESMRPATP